VDKFLGFCLDKIEISFDLNKNGILQFLGFLKFAYFYAKLNKN
jgi:hypothetical protein